MRFGDYVEINPKVKLIKRQLHAFVEMKDLDPSIRTVCSQYDKEFSGSGSKFENGDTLFARITPCLENGKTSQFRGDSSPAWGSTEFIILRSIPDKSDNNYVYYFSRSPAFRSHAIQNMVGSSGRQRVPNDAIRDFECEFPPINEQKIIAHILGTLDDKIELNQKMSQTLEEIAKAIFKSWFVDFDPVKAKAENRTTGLPPEISNLFPDEFMESEIGEIPRGWSRCEVKSFVTLNEESWSKRNHPESVDYLDLGNIKSNQILDTETFLWDQAPSRARRVLKLGDTIIGTVRPGNRSYGFIQTDGITGSTGFAVLTPNQKEYSEFVYLGVCSDNNIDRLAHLADGAAYPAVSNKIILETSFVHPPSDLIKWFHRVVNPLMQNSDVAEQENKILSQLRDTLLPKLISGELRIPDAEKLAEEVL